MTNLTATDIPWKIDPAPWPTPQIELVLVLEAIACTEHPTILGALEQLTHALVTRDEQLQAVRLVMTAALTFTYESDQRRQRLEQQLHELRAARQSGSPT